MLSNTCKYLNEIYNKNFNNMKKIINYEKIKYEDKEDLVKQLIIKYIKSNYEVNIKNCNKGCYFLNFINIDYHIHLTNTYCFKCYDKCIKIIVISIVKFDFFVVYCTIYSYLLQYYKKHKLLIRKYEKIGNFKENQTIDLNNIFKLIDININDFVENNKSLYFKKIPINKCYKVPEELSIHYYFEGF